MPRSKTMLPAAPLTDLIAKRGGVAYLMTGVEESEHGELDYALSDPALHTEFKRIYRMYRRAVMAGCLTPYAADELAIRLLGMHPASIYGWAFFDLDDDDTETVSVATLDRRVVVKVAA